MSELVAVNGMIQSVHQYMKVSGSIIFHQAPQAGALISIMTEEDRFDYEADGSTYTFPWPVSDRSKFKWFMEEVYKNKDNPTVKDQLEKLKAVMELVR
jgi:hypothetical protein